MATYTITIDERSEQGKKILSTLLSSAGVTVYKARKATVNTPNVNKKSKKAFFENSRRSIATNIEKYL